MARERSFVPDRSNPPFLPAAVRMGRAILLACGLSVAGFIGTAGATTSDKPLDVCNHSSFVVDTALGLEVPDGAATQGWFRVLPGACRDILREGVGAHGFLIHARPLPAYPTHAESAEAGMPLCVRDGDFVIAGAQTCNRDGQYQVPFAQVVPEIRAGRRVIVLDEAVAYRRPEAVIAGIQRLLRLKGYDVGLIDGVKGRRTARAVDAFVAEFGLDNTRETDVLRALVRAMADAPNQHAPQFCNDTSVRVMLAVGLKTGDRTETHGWFPLSPGACETPLAAPLFSGVLYTFAEAVDLAGVSLVFNGQPLAWGGDVALCTKNLQFHIKDHDACAARGLLTTGFRAWDLPEAGPLVIRFERPSG